MRTLLKYAREPFRRLDAFKRAVERETADTLELDNGVSLSAYPCRPEAVRGVRACVVCVDELAFFTTSEGRPVDTEMLRVARGRVATTGGRVIILSSPYAQSGALWDLHRKHYAREDSTTLIWQAAAPDMNPKLPKDYLARMEADDPDAYRSEVLGEFRAGIASLFDPETLDVLVDRGRRESLPEKGVHYAAHYDSSGGRADAAALAVAHRSGQVIHVDLVRRFPSPHNPETIIQAAAEILRAYGLDKVQVDRYAGDFPIRAFERAGIRATVAEKVTSEHHLGMLPLVNSRSVVLPDHPDLLRELRGLERRTGTGGKDVATHRPGAHDDAAAAVSAVCAALPLRAAPVYAAPSYVSSGRFAAGWGGGDSVDADGDSDNDHAAVADPGGSLGESARRGRRGGTPSGW